jgi:anion-transporting  ArsA/GET3 family ATPase
LTAAHLRPVGVELSGELWAMVLDPKQTFDDLVERLAGDEQTRDRVFANHIYRELSGAVGGSHDFSAIAKLYELDRDSSFDAIVLDTPPSRDTLDFLRAPQRLIAFFDARALRLLLAPAGFGARLARHAATPALSLLRRLVGVDLLGEIGSFFAAVSGLTGGLRERAKAVELLLHDPACTFVLISSAEHEQVRETIAFDAQLRAAGLQPSALIVNRVHDAVGAVSDSAGVESELSGSIGPRLADLAMSCVHAAQLRAQHEHAEIEQLDAALGELRRTLIPNFDVPLGDLEMLGAVTRRLFAIGDPAT